MQAVISRFSNVNNLLDTPFHFQCQHQSNNMFPRLNPRTDFLLTKTRHQHACCSSSPLTSAKRWDPLWPASLQSAHQVPVETEAPLAPPLLPSKAIFSQGEGSRVKGWLPAESVGALDLFPNNQVVPDLAEGIFLPQCVTVSGPASLRSHPRTRSTSRVPEPKLSPCHLSDWK